MQRCQRELSSSSGGNKRLKGAREEMTSRNRNYSSSGGNKRKWLQQEL